MITKLLVKKGKEEWIWQYDEKTKTVSTNRNVYYHGKTTFQVRNYNDAIKTLKHFLESFKYIRRVYIYTALMYARKKEKYTGTFIIRHRTSKYIFQKEV